MKEFQALQQVALSDLEKVNETLGRSRKPKSKSWIRRVKGVALSVVPELDSPDDDQEDSDHGLDIYQGPGAQTHTSKNQIEVGNLLDLFPDNDNIDETIEKNDEIIMKLSNVADRIKGLDVRK